LPEQRVSSTVLANLVNTIFLSNRQVRFRAEAILLLWLSSAFLPVQAVFEDRVLAKGEGVEVRESQLDEMYIAFRANRAAMGQQVPEAMRARIESEFLDRLISTQLIINRAAPEDGMTAQKKADEFMAEQLKQALSEQSFHRQVRAMGFTMEKFQEQIHEQALLRAVIERELVSLIEIDPIEIEKFYQGNQELFRQPEMVRLTHLLISTSDASGAPLSPSEREAKRQLAFELLKRVQDGEDLKALAQQFSDDHVARARGSEYLFTRAEEEPRRATLPEIEKAAFSLEAGGLSEVISSRLGFHLIRVEERLPSRTEPLAEVEMSIREALIQEEIEKRLPDYVEKLKKEAGVEIIWAGYQKPPREPLSP
jgi:peptidyl-prolyl cis-trans isomerase C